MKDQQRVSLETFGVSSVIDRLFYSYHRSIKDVAKASFCVNVFGKVVNYYRVGLPPVIDTCNPRCKIGPMCVEAQISMVQYFKV